MVNGDGGGGVGTDVKNFQCFECNTGNWQFCHECGATIRCTECVRIICITMDSYSKVSHKRLSRATVSKDTKKKNEKLLEKAENKWYRTSTGTRVPAILSLEY